ncbi:MAG: glycosyltransferase [Eubacterium sp.]|nr:glycosyltransferase [Eubacterium sp.]
MSEPKKFFFDKIRATADMTERVVVQGYAADGFLENVRPRAAVFVGGKPVKALSVTLEVSKLPPLYYRRREGNTMSYMAFFYVDMKDVSRRLAEKSSAKLVIIVESKKRERTFVYKGSLGKLKETAKSFSFNVNDAYIHDGQTFLSGWIGGEESAIIKIEGMRSTSAHSSEVGVDGSSRVGGKDFVGPLSYQIERIEHREISITYPELPESEKLGFNLSVDGEYKKLRVTMALGDKSYTKLITTGKSNFELDASNNLVRYSGKVVRNLKNYGVKETFNKIKLHMYLPVLTQSRRYNKWIRTLLPDAAEIERQKKEQAEFKVRPLLSLLVPLYETDETFLRELIDSVKNQTYDNWEICFSDGSKDSSRLSALIKEIAGDDERIRYIAEKKGPLGISENTNQAFTIAKGDFVVLGDHDDLIDPDAFYYTVKALNDEENADLIDVIYTDEDKTNAIASRRFEPTIKPAYNQLLLESCNYITHMFVVRSSIVKEIGGFNEKCDGAQDYDFILRCIEKARKVHHINRVLYSWRISEKSTAGNPKAKMYAYDSGVKALQDHYDRMGIEARAEIGDHLGYYHTDYKIKGSPLLYVVIVGSDDEKYKLTVDSIRSKSDFKNIEFIRVDAGEDMSYADMLNRGRDEVEMLVANDDETSPSEVYVVFIEAGITMMGEDDLSGMLAILTCRRDVNVIGGKVYCANGTVSHAGVILNTDMVRGYEYMGQSISKDMYFKLSEYSALRRGVTMFRLGDLRDYGEFSTDYKGGYSLIDYTLGITRKKGRCAYSANANFLTNVSRGLDADIIFEGDTLAEDEELFYNNNSDIKELGDIYYR